MTVKAPNFRAARYRCSVHYSKDLPPDTGAEVAIVGRSNAGKSTAINALTQIKGLAKTSKTPGRTQQINFFDLNDELRLVDLPGYGFAKVSDRMRTHWDQLISEYLSQRRSLRGLVIVMDIRRPLMPADQRLIAWAHRAELPAHLLLNKADKLKHNQRQKAIQGCLNGLAEMTHGEIGLQIFSGMRGEGVTELAAQLTEWLSAPATSDD